MVDGERGTPLVNLGGFEFSPQLLRAGVVPPPEKESRQHPGGWTEPRRERLSLLRECQRFRKRFPSEIERLQCESGEEIGIELQNPPSLDRCLPISSGLAERSREPDAHD